MNKVYKEKWRINHLQTLKQKKKIDKSCKRGHQNLVTPWINNYCADFLLCKIWPIIYVSWYNRVEEELVFTTVSPSLKSWKATFFGDRKINDFNLFYRDIMYISVST